jgi:hypothetical protein
MLNVNGRCSRELLDLLYRYRVSKSKKGGGGMKKKWIRRKGSVSLAVVAVRDLEKLLIKASRKRKLTADDRQKLMKCAAYLERKRKRSLVGNRIFLGLAAWIKILRFLADMVVGARNVKNVFDGLMGGK